MKKYLILIIAFTISGILYSCKNKPDTHAIRQQVLDQHDQLMIVSEQAIYLKIALDTLNLTILQRSNTKLDTTIERKQIIALSKSLADADDQMSDWMHNFKADFKGRPGQDALSYFSSQKAQVGQLNDVYRVRIEDAKDYLKRFNIVLTTNNHPSMKM